jgi:hypothetical protein
MFRFIPLLVAGAALTAGPLASQPVKTPSAEVATDPFNAAEARSTVEKLATALEDNFVFEDKGKAYAAMLRTKLASGGYASFPNAKAFAEQVSADLQAVHKDGHLRLHIIPPQDRNNSADDSPISLPPTSAVTKSGWLAPGVAYISFGMFPGNEATLKA